MSLEIIQIPVWEDNYIYLIHDKVSQQTTVIDPAESQPVNACLHQKNWKLDFIWNTHHHFDHVGGNLELKKKWDCKIYGYQDDAHRIPGIDQKIQDQGEVFLGDFSFQILFVPGHTLGHIAYWCKKEQLLFCGDCLFAMGCGRLFEGTPEQMFKSLSKIKELPQKTQVYCAHEYTLKNAQFALSLFPKDIQIIQRAQATKQLRKAQKPTIPFTLQEELLTNPFLKARTLKEFTHFRALRDQF